MYMHEYATCSLHRTVKTLRKRIPASCSAVAADWVLETFPKKQPGTQNKRI